MLLKKFLSCDIYLATKVLSSPQLLVIHKFWSYPPNGTLSIESPSLLGILKSHNVPPTFLKTPVGIELSSVSVTLSALIANM